MSYIYNIYRNTDPLWNQDVLQLLIIVYKKILKLATVHLKRFFQLFYVFSSSLMGPTLQYLCQMNCIRPFRARLVWGNGKEKKGKDSKTVSFSCLVEESESE